MKEALITTIVGAGVIGLVLVFPFVMFAVVHTWDAAIKWDCDYNGGHMVANSRLDGPLKVCVL